MLQELIRESRLARAGAWCSLLCVPGLAYGLVAPALGYHATNTTLVGLGLALPFFAGAALASGLLGVAVIRSAAQMERSGAPEAPAPNPQLALRRAPALSAGIAVVCFFLALSALRGPGEVSLSGWIEAIIDIYLIAVYTQMGRAVPAGRIRVMLFTVAGIAVCWLLRWGRAEAAGWLLLSGLALWEARDGWRERQPIQTIR